MQDYYCPFTLIRELEVDIPPIVLEKILRECGGAFHRAGFVMVIHVCSPRAAASLMARVMRSS